MNSTYLAFDFGMKYIGVAVGQSITKTASPITTLSARDGIPKWQEIEELIQQWSPTALIIGIPLNMDGTEQLLTFCAKKFANRLKEKFKLPIHTVDERLSTWEAKNRLQKSTKTKKVKQSLKDIDALSAVILLEQWLNDN